MFLDKVMSVLKYSLDSNPKPYGTYHIFWIFIAICSCIFTFHIAKKSSNKKRDKFLFIVSIIMITLELYRQIAYSYSNGGWHYDWGILPFQFCSMPIYLTLLVSKMKESKLRDTIYMFLATYTPLAGLSVMLFPSEVLVAILGINVQSMIHHILMIMLGIYLWTSRSIKLKEKLFSNAVIMFSSMIIIALILDCFAYGRVDGIFNMFYVSPYYITPITIGNWIQINIGYVPFVISYVAIFSGMSYLVLLLNRNIYNLKNANDYPAPVLIQEYE